MEVTPINPLSATSISPALLHEHGAIKNRSDSPTAKPYALITTKQHPTLPLSIHNYNSRAFWSSSPLSTYSSAEIQAVIDSPELSDQGHLSLALALACRSLVTHSTTGSVVARSFSKFFNFHEKLAYQTTGNEYAYEIEEKLDGSIVTLFWFDAKDHDPDNLLGPGRGGQWIIASRSSFDSPHIKSAWDVLGKRYLSVLDTRATILDKSRAYVFELIDPRLPIKVRYTGPPDLALLSIISQDGQEPKARSDVMEKLPFRRPRRWTMQELIGGITPAPQTLDPVQLTKLHRENEEGFVIKFWRTKDDHRPQRIKAKLELYLKSLQNAASTSSKNEVKSVTNIVDSLARISIKASATKSKGHAFQVQVTSAPSASKLLSIYTQHRLTIHSFVKVEERMAAIKPTILQAIQDLDIMDDYGGEAWLDKISRTFDRIHALFTLHEEAWRETVQLLEHESFKPQSSSTKPKGGSRTKRDFEKRIAKSDVDKTLRGALMAWFEGQEVPAIVKLVTDSFETPPDLDSSEAIVL